MAPMVFIVLVLLVLHITREAESLLQREIVLRAERASGESAALIDAVMTEAARTAKVIAAVIEDGAYEDDENLKSLIADAIMELNIGRSSITGGSITFAPFARHADREFCMFYTHLVEGEWENVEIADGEYNYLERSWYRDSDRVRGSWSEPYFDDGLGEILMTTFSYPFFTASGEFAGMVTIDISLDQLGGYVRQISGDGVDYPFLLSAAGGYVVHPRNSKVGHGSVWEDLPDDQARHESYKEFWENEIFAENKRFGSIDYPFSNIDGRTDDHITFTKLKNSDWVVGAVVTNRQLFAPLRELQHFALMLGGAAVALIMLLLAMVTFHALRPLRELSEAALKVGGGDLTVSLPETDREDEVGMINDAFHTMLLSLKDYIGELRKTTAAKNRIESELEIAARIQAWILPELRALPHGDVSVDICGELFAAKAVGGDLFDVFYISEDKLCISIGDVSGKGVPAALFMAVTQTLLRGIATPERCAADIVNRINANLARNNDMMMFVTYFLGIIDLRTGVMSYVNAGHNPAIIAGADGSVRELIGVNGPPLAISDHVYTESELTLPLASSLLLYTDGITESQNTVGEQFSAKRLLELVGSLKDNAPQTMFDAILRDVKLFADGAEQYDDITMLAIRINTPFRQDQAK